MTVAPTAKPVVETTPTSALTVDVPDDAHPFVPTVPSVQEAVGVPEVLRESQQCDSASAVSVILVGVVVPNIVRWGDAYDEVDAVAEKDPVDVMDIEALPLRESASAASVILVGVVVPDIVAWGDA
jgi:hypothetical protein